MDYFQAKETFTEMYGKENVKFSFDDTCHRTIELVFTEGEPNPHHHISYNKLRIDVAKQKKPLYVPIATHRETIPHEEIMKKVKDI